MHKVHDCTRAAGKMRLNDYKSVFTETSACGSQSKQGSQEPDPGATHSSLSRARVQVINLKMWNVCNMKIDSDSIISS